MLLLIQGDFFPRRRRSAPRYAQDELPLGPLIEVLSLSILLTAGGLFGASAVAVLYVTTALDLPLGPGGVWGVLAMGVMSPVCFRRALILWYRLTR
jgi:hypothetical protein